MIPTYLSAIWPANATTRGSRLRQAMLFAAVAAFLVFGLLNGPQLQAQSPPTVSAAPPSFEVASIKPNHSAEMRIGFMFQPGRFTTTGATLKHLITLAYNIKDFQVSGGPSWISSDKYDIEAKESDSEAEALEKLPPDERGKQMDLMLQSLLADRFKLKVSRATKELPVYALVVAKNGPKLTEAKPGDTYQNGIKGPDGHPAGGAGMMRMGPGQLTGQGLPMESLAHLLSEQVGRNIVDQTGLKGKYDFTLQWAPDQRPAGMLMGPEGPKPATDNAPPPDTSGPSIFTAIQEQLGLKLESTKGPVEIIVIDHVEQPSEN